MIYSKKRRIHYFLKIRRGREIGVSGSLTLQIKIKEIKKRFWEFCIEQTETQGSKPCNVMGDIVKSAQFSGYAGIASFFFLFFFIFFFPLEI